ncbi:LOW QUALITY PROTEIN: polyunsaturated fatty acid lipoxygenase ALOX15B [Phaenicophaeus curvirostris]|uniref:LOW QUALITY PROTEIN: polyunsaturated fatty acid lipoxygenase ALOX15B n=1 Tax=Phaenicophaeus curvirostris TaxID=33595 RepID=UPI0037F098ED
MAVYKVTVATGDVREAGTNNSISITLVGTRGESQRTNISFLFLPGTERKLTVSCPRDLGPIVLVRLHKWRLFLEDAWFCKDVQVTAPDGTLYRFPCYQWLEGVTTLDVREGAGKKLLDDELELLREQRRQELKARQEAFQWKTFSEGWPRCLNVDSITELDSNAQFSCVRATNFNGLLIFQGATHLLSGFLLRRSSWKSLDEMRSIFSRTRGRNIVPEYVAQHWQEDEFFGYQFLNGNNPIVLRRCPALPPNFPVTPEMVAASLGPDTDLEKELARGRLFLVDYAVLDGLPTGPIHGRQQHAAAPLCLLHLGRDGRLRPIAIQINQTPGPTNPIFLPSDSEWDWLVAKTWVRNADFYSHQVLTHLLRTHLFAEVFAMATMRQLPSCHPLFKLLHPHFRFTFHINTLARTVLINPGGVIEKGSGLSHEGLRELGRRGLEAVTYRSLCLPEDIEDRGLGDVPGHHYREDARELWDALESYVSGIVKLYYLEDASVREDPELQAWILDIFTNGFLGRASSGIPSALTTRQELSRFLTMVVFTCSAQHAAVNNAQYDLGAFLPNAPSSMRLAPPQRKGQGSLTHLLETLPDVATTANILVALILLSSQLDDRRVLGEFPEVLFTEGGPRALVRALQGRLAALRDRIEERNEGAELRYGVLSPREVENSVSI